MQKKKIWIFLLTGIVFLSSVVLGITSTYRIDAVTVLPAVVSEAAKSEAEALQQQLFEAYEKDSYFSVDKEKAEKIMQDFPYFRMVSFKKSHPNRIIVEVVEDEELYAVPVAGVENSYYILGVDGTVLGIRDSYSNRLDGAENLLLKGFTAVGERGKKLSGDVNLNTTLELCQEMSRLLGGIRRNAVLVEVLNFTSSQADTILRFSMREGIKIYIGNISSLTKEKAAAAIEKYYSLSDDERLTGRIAVSDNNGEIVVGYARKDEFVF